MGVSYNGGTQQQPWVFLLKIPNLVVFGGYHHLSKTTLDLGIFTFQLLKHPSLKVLEVELMSRRLDQRLNELALKMPGYTLEDGAQNGCGGVG